ncbi:inorganic pyrophosphatase [Echria macrotheca]|uniref:inorganic diphosphatase n=1 Tax=Echria macrotheca TaxID=438768 RepID=A0AAJ0B3M6_9PEZI|nr:inorganic pyrophosphatase [Echria macrotheca]
MDIETTSDEEYTVRKVGRPFTKDYRVYFERRKDGIPISPFHDIPLYHDKDKGILNMVVEVPRWSNAKFEISRDISLNPIVQDTLSDEPRFVKSCFPYKGYLWNYGALPQTWEDPTHTDPATHKKGDNDPLDACEISRHSLIPTGGVRRVKPLGILGLIDTDETDWKVVVIDVDDPLAEKLDDIEDVERELPGLLDATRDWFRIYKVPDGGRGNGFAFGGAYRDRKLVKGEADSGKISLENTTLKGTPGKLDPEEVKLPPGEDLSPAPTPRDIEEWFFVDREKLDREGLSLDVERLDIVLDIK